MSRSDCCGNVITSVLSIKVCLTSTMESTSLLPCQSGSYISAKHACTFLEDSCIADDNDTWFPSVEQQQICARQGVWLYLYLSNLVQCASIRTPFTASRYALRSLCSLEPSVWGQNANNRVEKTKTKRMRSVSNCRDVTQICKLVWHTE